MYKVSPKIFINDMDGILDWISFIIKKFVEIFLIMESEMK